MIRPALGTRPMLRTSLALAAVVVLTFTSQVSALSRPARSLPATRRGPATSASSAATQRMSASLQDSATTGSARLVDVLVIEKKGTGRPGTLKTALRVTLKADPDNEYWAGRVPTDRLAKLASGKGVEYVADNGPQAPPVVPDSSASPAFAQLAAGKQAVSRIRKATASGVVKSFADAVNSESSASAPGGLPTDWYEIGLPHKSALAWANGFTGTGVKVGVADDGVDFAHPDLQGTQAYNTDPTSPYYGWPMAFDPYSTYLYAMDALTGSNNVEIGTTWFSATTDVATGADPSFRGQTYALPGTSKSGTYHIGVLWDQNLASSKWFGHYPAMLVADEHTAGVYDTVYVDLNDNLDFTDDKACTKGDPISYLDYVDAAGNPGSDGIADLSGGMVYWISDGTHQPPYADEVFSELDSAPGGPPAAGALVCMMGSFDSGSDHGTLCASGVAGQGRIDGKSVTGVHPSFKTGSGGMVQGAGRDVRLVGIGDVYSAYSLSTLLAYDFAAYGPDSTAGTGDEVQIVSNSYGESTTDNDEWDFGSRYITLLNTGDAPSTAFLFATGNGGPGYGTSTPPSASTGIKVGASTQFGADGGWDSIDTSSQVTYGDVAPFSDRGPSAMGHLSPTIVADGAYASGDVALNFANGNGWTAWDVWGGTSRSTPVASGNLALVYQAFRGANGRWPTYDEARMLLASGGTDLNYDTFVQGAGMVDANRSTLLAAGAAGAGVEASPSAWYPGGFEGSQPMGFEQVVSPGDTLTSPLTLTNPGTAPASVTISDSWMQKTGSEVVTVTLDASRESAFSANRPDALLDLSSVVPAGTQLLVVRATAPLSQIDPNDDGTAENSYRLLAYDWTDRNGNGRLWNDSNANGAVNTGEIDANEYMRFNYCLATGPLSAGLNEIMLHNVVYAGTQTSEQFSGETGVLNASASALGYAVTDGPHASGLSFTSTLDLPGFSAEGYGLSPAWTSTGQVDQDGTWTHEFDIAHGGYIEASIANQGSDLDLYLDSWNGSGWDPIAASETPMGDEYLKVLTPDDGHYRIRVYGFDVSGGTDSFDVRLAAPQGTGVTVTGVPPGTVPAGVPIALSVHFSTSRPTLDERDQVLLGVVSCGPAGSIDAVQIPVTVTYPLLVESTTPEPGSIDASTTADVTVRFSRRVDPDTLTGDSLYLTADGEPVDGTITYDDSSATAHIAATLAPDTIYTVHVTGDIATPDGTAMQTADWIFSTGGTQLPTAVKLSLKSSTARYGAKVSFTATATRGPSGVGYPDGDAPLAIQFRATGSSVWTTVTTGVASTGGVWSGSVTASRPGSYRARRTATPSGTESTSAMRSLAVTFAPTISVSTTTTRHGGSFKVTAHVRPSAQAARRTARIEIYSRGRWVLSHYVKLSSSGNATFYERRSTKGTRKIRLRLTSGKGYGTGASASITLRWN